MEMYTSVLDWFENLRSKAAAWFRDRCIQLFLENAAKLGYDYDSLEKMQDAWAEADDDEKRGVVGKQLNLIFRSGYFAQRKDLGENGWKFEMEKELMEKFGLAYLPKENEVHLSNKHVSCLARQASRSRADTMKRVQLKGKKKHGLIVTKRGFKREKEDTNKRSRRVKGSQFQDSFVRNSEKAVASGKAVAKETRTMQSTFLPVASVTTEIKNKLVNKPANQVSRTSK